MENHYPNIIAPGTLIRKVYLSQVEKVRYKPRFAHRYANLLSGPDYSPRFLSIRLIPQPPLCTTGQGQQGIYYRDQGTEGLNPTWLCYQKTETTRKQKQAGRQITANHSITCDAQWRPEAAPSPPRPRTPRGAGTLLSHAAYSRPHSLIPPAPHFFLFAF